MGATRRRVVTWNIRAAIGPGPFPDRWWRRIDPDRLRAIGDVLARLEPDVVALQEVAVVSRDGDLVDNAGDLGRQLGMAVRYGATRTFAVTEADRVVGAGIFGNAILAREPIRHARTLALPAAPAEAYVEEPDVDHPAAGLRYADAPVTIREPRCLLVAEVDGLLVGTAHLSHIGAGERRLQAEAIATALGDAGPAVVLGDLNAAIDAPELAPLATWVDGFGVPAGHADRVTTDDGYRIDHVLGRGVGIDGCRAAREAGDLSDHLPVVATVAADPGGGRTSFVASEPAA